MTLRYMNDLASTYIDLKWSKVAEDMLRRSWKTEEQLLELTHPNTLMSRHNLACALMDQGQYDEDVALEELFFRRLEEVYGPENPESRNVRLA